MPQEPRTSPLAVAYARSVLELATAQNQAKEIGQELEELGKIVQADPDVATVAMVIGGSGRAGNNGSMYITLKPRDERSASAQEIIARLRPKLDKVEGAKLFMQAAQDVRLGGRPTRTQFEFTLQDANLSELNEWAPKLLTKMQTLPEALEYVWEGYKGEAGK